MFILLQLTELGELGYRAIALGFFEDDVQAVYTPDCSSCITAKLVDYIHAVIIAGIIMFIMIFDHTSSCVVKFKSLITHNYIRRY